MLERYINVDKLHN